MRVLARAAGLACWPGLPSSKQRRSTGASHKLEAPRDAHYARRTSELSHATENLDDTAACARAFQAGDRGTSATQPMLHRSLAVITTRTDHTPESALEAEI